MAIVYKNKEYRNLQEQVLENAKNIAILQEKPGLQPVIVDELPETGEVGILYLVPSEDPETENAYDEYVWVEEENAFEMVGSTTIDLSHLPSPTYVTTANKPEGLTYGLRINNNGWTSDIQQEGGTKIELTGTAVKISGPIELGTGMQIKNHDQSSSNYIDFEQGGFRRATIGSATYFYTNVVPGGSQELGTNTARWRGIYLGDNGVSLGGSASVYPTSIKVDSASRIGFYHNNVERIKIGNENSTYCVANWTPDADATYTLGKSNMRWATVNASSVANDYSNLTLKGNPGITVNLASGGAIQPSATNSYTLGTSSSVWNNVFTTNISDGTNSVAVSDIATKPDYDNPNVWASGTLGASTGEGTIDLNVVGTPDEGLYLFEYGYGQVQCYITLTSSGLFAATLLPLIVTCPVLQESSGTYNNLPGNLTITRSADILTLKVSSGSEIAESTSGFA